jgi:hypothetical protein
MGDLFISVFIRRGTSRLQIDGVSSGNRELLRHSEGRARAAKLALCSGAFGDQAPRPVQAKR